MARPEINSCLTPTPVRAKEAEVYTSIRDTVVRAHCAAKRPSHRCCGKITLTRTDMTLNCPLCGDAKSLIRPTQDKRR